MRFIIPCLIFCSLCIAAFCVHSELNPTDKLLQKAADETSKNKIIYAQFYAFDDSQLSAFELYFKEFSQLSLISKHDQPKQNSRVTTYEFYYAFDTEKLVFLLERVCREQGITCSFQSDIENIYIVAVDTDTQSTLPYGVW